MGKVESHWSRFDLYETTFDPWFSVSFFTHKFFPNHDKFIHYSPWKYIINLAGSELPLFSVDELSNRLTKNSVKIASSSYYDPKFDMRYKYEYKEG